MSAIDAGTPEWQDGMRRAVGFSRHYGIKACLFKQGGRWWVMPATYRRWTEDYV